MTAQPRFFYPANRAHHAYVMAKDFGMEFECRFDTKWKPEDLLNISAGGGYRIYVHADSLGLMEPKPGDLMTNIGIAAWRLSGISGDRLLFSGDKGDWFGRRNEMQIIHRQGIAFHYPEVER